MKYKHFPHFSIVLGPKPLAFISALNSGFGLSVSVLDYHEHAIGSGETAKAVCYMELKIDGNELWGVGTHTDIVTASLRAIISGLNVFT